MLTISEMIGEDVQFDHHIAAVQLIVTPAAQQGKESLESSASVYNGSPYFQSAE